MAIPGDPVPCPTAAVSAATGTVHPVGDAAVWAAEEERNVERYRRLRRGALAADAAERRRILAEAGVSSITELDSLARIARTNAEAYRRAAER